MVFYRYPLYRDSKDMNVSDVSVDGFAFACCAAALPVLLRSTVPAILSSLGSLIQAALPLIISPLHDSMALNEVEISRFQHMINRIEQVHYPPPLHSFSADSMHRSFLSSAGSLMLCRLPINVERIPLFQLLRSI